MTQTKKRNLHSPELKAKVGLEALRGVKTINEIGLAHGVHPVQVGQWKREIQEQASQLSAGKRGPKPTASLNGQEALYAQIGQLKVELDWLKKVGAEPVMKSLQWIASMAAITREAPVRIGRRCQGNSLRAAQAQSGQ